MSDIGRLDCVPCSKFKYWLEFQLLDNQGTPLAGIPYILKSRDGVINAKGVTDGQGILREEDLSPLPMTLHVETQKLADQLVEKPTADVMKIKKALGSLSTIMPGELSDGLPKIKGWTEDALQTDYYANPEYPGITVMPEHNRRHMIVVERIVNPVFAKSCLQPAGCTDAGTETEPHTHFGQMQIYQTVPKSDWMETAEQGRKNHSDPLIFEAVAWVGNQIFPRAEANPVFIEPYLQMVQQTQAQTTATIGAAANQDNNGHKKESKPLLSHNEIQALEGVQFGLSKEYRLASMSTTILGVMLRQWWDGSDKGLLHLENLRKIADKKGTAPTRIRYRFAENPQTGQLTAVGYHTSKESGLEKVKVRHVQHNESLNRYEFWEDGASSPTLIWYQDALSGELSQQHIDNPVSQNSTANVKVAVLDPKINDQTPGLPMPEQRDWRDSIYANPQQDPNKLGENSTSTPIPDARDNGTTKLTTPAPQEKDFRDYILIFPISNIPAIYVYLSSNHDKGSGLIDGIPRNPGTVRRFMSTKEYKKFKKEGFIYDPNDSRGGISVTSIKVDPKNPDSIKRSTGALGADYYMDIDTSKKNVELKGKTKGGVMDWKIKDNVTEDDIIKYGRVEK
ncbi:hypothetical protein Xmau_01470 [Xenorhabdus mauleonii]|uniref:S-type Pyocin n=1 Tax=Xenorhabdus mauleonii TaxID=351675 RepID=A0A1I3PME9_9GAMM|nr:S-type pyocin domain-containing protein [Xenorhabdus mauleonii]PHM44756.1 hypothetical protein Xmau_01470 [Xenorhabdus mauleonii]SFJ22520.1 S-type Pyocin [Xenorhabdus mauleonii]